MNNIKSNTYTQTKKLVCDSIDEKNYLIQYRLLKCFFRHGLVVDKVHEIISFRQSNWLEKKYKFPYTKEKSSCESF